MTGTPLAAALAVALPLALALALTPAETNGRGTPARWEGRVDAHAVVENANRGNTFSLLLSAGDVGADARVAARVRPDGGAEDAGGGVVLRAADDASYYVCRWNPLEENLRLYAVVRGARRTLATKVVRVPADGAGREVALSATGDRLLCSFEGDPMILVRDGTLRGPGRAGVWVKADARTTFLAVSIVEERAPGLLPPAPPRPAPAVPRPAR